MPLWQEHTFPAQEVYLLHSWPSHHFLCGSIKCPFVERNWCHSHFNICRPNINYEGCRLFQSQWYIPKNTSLYYCLQLEWIAPWAEFMSMKAVVSHFPFISTKWGFPLWSRYSNATYSLSGILRKLVAYGNYGNFFLSWRNHIKLLIDSFAMGKCYFYPERRSR